MLYLTEFTDDTLVCPFTREGYTFIGWNTKADGSGTTVAAGDACAFTTNQTLYAQWEPNTVNVLFVDNKPQTNGDITWGDPLATPASRTYAGTYGQDLFTFDFNDSTALSLPGYTFGGFSIAKNGDSITYTTDITVDNLGDSLKWNGNVGSVTLYAQWTPRQYFINLHANGGQFPSGQTDTIVQVTYDSLYSSIKGAGDKHWSDNFGVVWEEHTVIGWFTGQNGGTKKEGSTRFEGDETQVTNLYAHWAGACHVYANGGSLSSPSCCEALNIPAGDKPYDYEFAVVGGEPTNQYLTGGGLGCITRAGYTLVGWYWDAQFTQPADLTQPYSNGELYAKWTADTIMVTFDGNEGNGSSTPTVPTSTTVTYDQRFGPLADASRDGYTFGGWYLNAEGAGTPISGGDNGTVCNIDHVSTLNLENKAVTLYAKWTADTITVNFDGNKGNGSSTPTVNLQSTTVTYDQKFGTLADASRVGYTFGGWYLNAEGTGTSITGGDNGTVCNIGNVSTLNLGNNTVTLYAKWTANPYTITYNAHGGTGTQPENPQATFDQPYASSLNWIPERYGYTFKGWWLNWDENNDSYTGEVVFGTTPCTTAGPHTLHAKWAPRLVTVTFAAPDATSPVDRSRTWSYFYGIPYNSSGGSFPSDPERNGYTFADWWLGETQVTVDMACMQGVECLGNVEENCTLTLTARWSPKQYPLTLDANGSAEYPAGFNSATDNGQTTVTATYGAAYSEITGWDAFGVSRTGFTLTGWKTAGGHDRTDESVFHDGDTASTFALYAQWEPNDYTVTFNGNATTGSTSATVPSSKQVTFSQTYGTLADASRTGYTFGGWFKEAACTNEVTAATVVRTPGDHSLYAKWTAKEYTVTYNGNAPAFPEGVTVTPPSSTATQTFDANYVLPADPTCPGYDFRGWYPNADGSGTRVTASTNCTTDEDHTLYAKWEKKSYHITFYSNGGSFSNSTSVYASIKYSEKYSTAKRSGSGASGSWVNAFGGISRTGYQFAGWWTDSDGGVQRQSDDIYTILRDEELYAHWTPKQYTCTVEDYTHGDNSHPATVNCSALENNNSTFIATFGQTFNASLGCDLNTDINCKGFTKKWQRKTGNNWWNWEDFDPATTIWEWESNQTIHAVWDKDMDLAVTVTLDANGGTVNPSNYSLKYWYCNSGRTNKYGKMETNGSSWNCDNFNNKNYLSNNVTISRTGYTFAGWWYNDEPIYDGTTLRSADAHTLTAHWTANDYTVTVHANGGTLPSACNDCMTTPTTFKVKYDHPMNYYLSSCTGCNLNDVTREGYTFGGWYMNEACTGNALNFNGTWLAAYDVDIYAKWIPNEYTVTFDANAPADATVTLDTTSAKILFDHKYQEIYNVRGGNTVTYGTLPTPNCTSLNYVFRGWFINGTGDEIENTTSCTTAENHTLVARWEPVITATLSQDSVSCHGFTDGKVTVRNISGGDGDYTVTITKGDASYSQTLARPASSITFTGTDNQPITAGEWTVAVFDSEHPDTFTGTGLSQCRFQNTVNVLEPDALAFTATDSSQTCYNQGSVLVNVSGGNGQYTVSWEGSTGISSQSGSREVAGQYGTGWSASTNITGLLAQEVTLDVTDQKGCPVADTMVVIGQPEETVPAFADVTKTVCSGSEFILPENRPAGVRYSWDPPTGTGCTGAEAGQMMPSVSGTLTNTTDQQQVYTYTVTPYKGILCIGEPFTVTVTVGPNRTDAPTVATVTSPDAGCARSDREIAVSFNNAVSNVTYQVNGGYSSGSMTAAATPANTYKAIVALPDTCHGDIGFSVAAVDGYGCDVQGQGLLQVRIAPWSIAESTYGSRQVTCLAEAVAPGAPTNVTDGCGNTLVGVLTATQYSTDNGASWTNAPFACAGQVRYTYTFTACDGSSGTWTYTYTVTGRNGDTIVVNNPVASIPADSDPARCIFQVPDLRTEFLNKIESSSTCSAPEEMTFAQVPQAGSFLNASTDVAVTLTDKCGQTSHYTVTVTVPVRPTVSSVTATEIACNGGTSDAMVTVNNGTAPYTYVWNDGLAQTGQTATDLVAGSYTVTVTDANGCVTYGFVTIAQPSAVQVAMRLSADTLCAGGSVVVSAHVSGGTAPYVYRWNNDIDSTLSVSPIQTLEATTAYTLSIKDAKGCVTDTLRDTVVVNPLPAVAMSGATICLGDTAVLTATGAESYVWSNGQGGAEVRVSPAATAAYTVTGTDAKGCRNTASDTVKVQTAPAVTIMNHPEAIAVLDSAVVGVRALAAGETVTWHVENDIDGTGGVVSILTGGVADGTACTATEIKLRGDAVGTVVVSATITQTGNLPNCATVTVADTILVRQSVITLACPEPSQDSIVYTGTPHRIAALPLVTNSAGDTLADCTFTYSVEGGAFTDTVPARTDAGSTQVTVRAAHSQYESNTCQYLLTVNRRPVTVEVADCAAWTGERLTTQIAGHYTVTGADSTLLGGDEVSGQIIASNASGGAYTYSDTSTVNTASKQNVRVMRGGADVTANYDIRVHSTQMVMQMQVAAVRNVTCHDKSNGEITVTVIPADDTYIYYIGNHATHSSEPGVCVYDSLVPGAYSVYAVTADGGCRTNTVTGVTVENVDPIVIAPADSTIDICAGAAIALQASADGGSLVYAYEWRDTRKDSVVGTTATVLNVAPADTTVYVLTVRDHSDAECFATARCTVNVRPGFPTEVVADTNRVCMNETLFLRETLNSADAHCTYQWTLGDNEGGVITGSATSSLVQVRWSVAGTKTVTVNVTNDSTGCVSTDFYEVTVDTLPMAAVVADRPNVCPGQDSVRLTAPRGEGYHYAWNITGNPDTCCVKVGVMGNYTVTVTDGHGCRSTATTMVGRYELPTVQINGGNTSVNICPGQQTAELVATPVEETFTYIWKRGNDTLNPNDPALTRLDNVAERGDYRVKVIDSVGCYAISNTVTVGHYVLPTVTVNNPTVCASGTAQLTANGAQTYSWSPTTYLDPVNNAHAFFSGAPAGTYTDTVTGVDGHGCRATAVARITVLPDVVLSINDSALLTQKVCAGTALDSIKIHVENGTLSLLGNLPRYVVFHNNTAIGNADIDGITDQTGTFHYSLIATSNQAVACPPKQLDGVIKVNPMPTLTITPAAQEVCAGSDIDTVLITCTNGILPETLTDINGLTYIRIDDHTARVFGSVQTSSLAIPIAVTSDQLDPVCNSVSDTLRVTVHPNPQVGIPTIADVCPANEATQVQAVLITPTTGAYTYYWTGGVWIDPMTTTTGETLNVVRANVPTVCSDSFALRVEVTDAHGCRSVDSAMMVVRDTTAPRITPRSDTLMARAIGNCKYEIPNLRDSVTVTDDCHTGAFDLYQDVAAGSTLADDEATKDVKVWVEGRCGHRDTALVVVRKPDPVAVSIVAADSVCRGSGTPLRATAISGFAGGITYTWTPNTGLSAAHQAEVVATPSETTTYTVTARDGNGCYATASTTLNVYPLPVVTIEPVAALCPNAGATSVTANVDANGGTATSFLYHWTSSDISLNQQVENGFTNVQTIDNIPTNTCNGEYTLNLEVTENVLNCKGTASTVIVVKDDAAPSITANFAQAWATTTGGSACVYTMPDLTDSSYTYTDACSQTWASLTQSIAPGTQIDASTPVTVTATDACGNAATTVVLVNVVNAFEIDANAVTVTKVSCYGGHDGVVSLYVQDQSAYTYKIDEGDYGTSTTFEGLAAGVHYLTVRNSNGCTSTLPVTVGEPDPFTMTIASVTPATCADGNGSVQITLQGGTPILSGNFGFEYEAHLTHANDTLLSQFTASPATMGNLHIGRYKVTVSDRNGCTATDSFEIALNNNLVVTEIPVPRPVCSGGSFATIPVTPTPGTTYYTWPLPEQSVTGGVTGTTMATLEDRQTSVNGAGLENNTGAPVVLTYHVTAHNGVCTFDTSLVMTVTATVRPQVVITPMDTVVCPSALDGFQLTASVANVYAERDTLTWNFNNEQTVVQYHDYPSALFTEHASVNISASECNKVYPFTVEYTDGVCASSAPGAVTVRIPDHFTIVAPSHTDTVVSCTREIQLPHLVASKWPSSVTDGCGQVVETFSNVTYPFLTDTICNSEVVFTYTFRDCSGNDTTYRYTYHVVRKTMELPADGTATVACESDAVRPASPGNQPDACGTIVTPVFPDSTAAAPNPVHDVVNGSGTVTYTYTYTTCDGRTYPWRFVYTVVPDPFTPFDTVVSNLHCMSERLYASGVPVPDTTICGTHIGMTLHDGYPQDVFSGGCGTRTYRYDYRVNGTDYEWYYIEKVEPEEFSRIDDQERVVACHSEISVSNMTIPRFRNQCGDFIELVSETPVVTPSEAEWGGCTDTVTYTFTYRDCAGREQEWHYIWIVKDTAKPVFVSVPEVVPANHGIENGNCAYTYPTMEDMGVIAYSGCNWNGTASGNGISYYYDHDPAYEFAPIEQTDEIQHLPVHITATSGCGVTSDAVTILVEVPAKLTVAEVLSGHKNVKCFGGSDGEVRVQAQGGTPYYNYSISEPAAVQEQANYFTGLPVPADSLRGTDSWGGIWYGHDVVTVTDAHGCTATDTVVISSPVKMEWENCPDTVVFCTDPGVNYRTITIGEDFTPPVVNTTANNPRYSRTSISSRYNVGVYTFSYSARNTCGETSSCRFYFQILPNASIKDSADNMNQEVCPNTEIDPVVFTIADADSISLTGTLPESMVSYQTTQLAGGRSETVVTISGNPNVTEPTVYAYTFQAYSPAVPGSDVPCSDLTYSGSITIHDTVSPTYAKPSDAVVYLDGSCQAGVDTIVTGAPAAVADNCSGLLTVTYRDEAPVADCGGAYHFDRVWRVVDPSGNVSRSDSVQRITVLDTVRPVIAAGYQTEWDATPNPNCNSNVPMIWEDILNHYASDNCGGVLTASQSPAEGTEIMEDTDVVVTVKDACGNEAAVSVHVNASGIVAIVIDSVDAGCYHTPNDGAVYFTIQGSEDSYNAYFNGQSCVLPAGENVVDTLAYGDGHTIVVTAAMPNNPGFICQTRKTFSIQPLADTLTLTANSGEWEYDNAEHRNGTYTVKFGGQVVSTDAVSETEVTLPTGDRVKAKVTGAITDAGTVENVLSDIVVMRGTDDVTCKYNQVLNNGTLTVNPAEITVTITGHNLTADYDGTVHSVSGYDVEVSDPFYTRNNIAFSGTDFLASRNVGTFYMNLASDQFQDAWPTPANIGTVTFVIAADGFLTVNKINATVNIAGHQGTWDYDGDEHEVAGYEMTSSTPLYTRADFVFSGDSLLTRTNAGTDSMHLASGQFANMNANFDTVTFIIDRDGVLTIDPIDVTVTVTGHSNTADYDNTEHTVTGYDLVFSTGLYHAEDIEFSGDSAASRTFTGTTNMGLAASQFANRNSNFGTVTFNVTDGYQTITPVNAVVTVVGNSTVLDYDGQWHTVSGYTVSATPAFYNVDTSFTFGPATDSVAERQAAGTTYMGLAPGKFTNTNPNFNQVTFNITDGFVKINKINAEVTVTGASDTRVYDGVEHSVSGYTVTTSTPLYHALDLSFNGTAEASRKNAGTTVMGLVADQFANTNANFETVTVTVVDGYQTIMPVEEVLVTIKGTQNTAVYDAQLHSVNGYTVVVSNPLYTESDFSFSGTAAAARTHVVENADQSGVTYMGLAASQFANTNDSNFVQVTFNVTDGFQKIDPAPVTVRIEGQHNSVLYDGNAYTVNGYSVTNISNPLYTEEYYTFTGTATATQTLVGTANMGLSVADFTNNNTDFDVTFEVTDGYMKVEPNSAVVTIVGNTVTLPYNGEEQMVTGYVVTSSNELYNAGQFTFSGDSTARRTDAGTTAMVLTADMFHNTDPNFEGNVTFNVTNGAITVSPLDVTVTVTGRHNTATYDGEPHTVTGYDLDISTPLYLPQYVVFNGTEADSTAARTDVDTTYMGLSANMFTDQSTDNFANVTFQVVDGFQAITPLDVMVDVAGHTSSVVYDGESHTITGYEVSPSTPLYTVADFSFNGDSTATRTDAGATNMGLTPNMFANTNSNFGTVTFNVTDGVMTVTPLDVTVAIAGHTAELPFNNEEQQVTGYDVNPSSPLFTTADIRFTGDSVARRTEVGTTGMNLANTQFANTNGNFGTVTFNVTDGAITIVPMAVTVTVTGHSNVAFYTGEEYAVSGFDTAYSTELYTAADFTFTPAADAVVENGLVTAKRTNVGTTYMGLAANQFANHNQNFDVTFAVTDGYQKVEPNVAVVTVTGRRDTLDYNGVEQQVTGYDWSSDNALYNDASFFTFSGDSAARRADAGTTAMGLTAGMFSNTNPNFAEVTFIVARDGAITVTPIDVTVTITEHSDTVDYDGIAHSVSGYDMAASNALYTGADFTFSGTDNVSGTNAGTYPMELSAADFANTNSNFANVTFVVVDGQLVVRPIDVTVTVAGTRNSAPYDGQVHTVTGFTATANTDLYKVADDNRDFTFSGNASASCTDADTTWMGLVPAMFANTNSNFGTVTFNVTDGYQAITPINVQVTVTGNTATNTFDNVAHTVTGYVATANTDLYKVTGNNRDFTFSGVATATRTNVVEGDDNTGKTYMGLTAGMFANTNGNFGEVTFNVTDGYQQINPAEVTVTIKGAVDSVLYLDGVEQSVSGYEVVSISNPLYAESDFSYAGDEDDTVAAGTQVSTYYMNLSAGQFVNNNTDFVPVFNVTNGHLAILSRHVTVTIAGNADTAVYDGQSHSVAGYRVVSIDQPHYTENDFTFTGDATAIGLNAGIYPMGLAAGQFENHNANYQEVTFVVTDGFLTVTPKPVEVLVTGNKDTADYNGSAHTVTGFALATAADLYDIGSTRFVGTVNDSTATRTDAGTTYMGLAASQFTNTDANFEVTFNVTDGYQYVNPAEVTVTVVGGSGMVLYNGGEQTVTGYTMTSDVPAFDPYANVTFTGTATASGTNSGIYPMGLTADMFGNTNVNYHVTFNVTDGQLRIFPQDVSVIIRGNVLYVTDDNQEHTVHGYTMECGNASFDLSCIEYVGGAADTVATGSVAGEYPMGLTADAFQVTCQDPNVIVGIEYVSDGRLTILPADSVVVTIKGRRDTVMYDGQPHTVEGYDWVASHPGYTADDFIFDGESVITRTDAGTYYTGYTGINFHPAANSAYQRVGFRVLNPAVLRIKKIDTMVVTIAGNTGAYPYDAASHTVTGYTATANCPLFDPNKIVLNNNDAAVSRTLAGTTYMGLTPSQFRYDDDNFSNVIFNVQDGYVQVSKKALEVTAPEDMVFSKVYDGTPLTVTYDQLRYNGLVGDDTITTGVITSESAAVGTYVCGAGQMWAYADNEDGVANASGFGEPSVIQNYVPAFNVTLRIDPVTDFACPDTLLILLTEGTRDTVVPAALLGMPENELLPQYATVGHNLDAVNPMAAGEHFVTWTIYDIDGNAMATCDQVVVVDYQPCVSVAYNGYTYPAVRIGSQCWLAENLRTTTDAEGSAIADYRAYRDKSENLEKFGYLYTWYSAVGVAENDDNAAPATTTAANGESYVQGICPEGWAVCSYADFETLSLEVGDAKLLKDSGTEYWNAGFGGEEENSGFNSRGGGFYNSVTSRFEDILTGAHYWKSDATTGSNHATGANVSYYCDHPLDENALKTDRRSVRCIKKQ